MWRMLNAEAVIFMDWNAGTDRRSAHVEGLGLLPVGVLDRSMLGA